MIYSNKVGSAFKGELINNIPAMNLHHTAATLDDAWAYWYGLITKQAVNDTETSRDGTVVGEIINATTVLLDPTRNILKSDIRKLPMRYMIGELLWYLSGNSSLDAIRNYTDAWDRMSDDGVSVNSNYGSIIQCCRGAYGRDFNQYDYVKELLRKDQNSRQAIIHIKTPRDTTVHPTKDLNCTIALQFFIRDGALHMTTFMRSNDLWMGFPNDVFQFTCLQIRMAMELGVDIGYYTHIAGSLHLYERDYKKSLENINLNGVTTGRIDCSKPNCFGKGVYENDPYCATCKITEACQKIHDTKETPETIVGQDEPDEKEQWKDTDFIIPKGYSPSNGGNPSM